MLQSEHLLRDNDQQGDDKRAPNGANNADDSPEGRNWKHITVSDRGHCDDSAPERSTIAVKVTLVDGSVVLDLEDAEAVSEDKYGGHHCEGYCARGLLL